MNYLLILHILFITVMEVEKTNSFFAIPKDTDFPLENIPFGVASHKTTQKVKYCATRIGDYAINLAALQNFGYFKGQLFGKLTEKVFQAQTLNNFMALQRKYWSEARKTIQQLFGANSPLKDNQEHKKQILCSVSDIVNHLPASIGDYTDFYSSRSHAFNVGSIIRGPANAIQQNWVHIPIGYHGRSSSIKVSGTELRRPRGQVKAKDATQPSFSDCKRLDFEVEMGAFIGGTPNELGKPIKVNEAWDYVFGFVLLNDWSFRDFQTWEYVPLGPFTAKNGLSSISPWIITTDALAGSEVQLKKQQPQPFKYLQQKKHLSYDINLQVQIKTPKMTSPETLATTNYKYMYWSVTQQLTHHAVTGCNMQAGDLLGSGTISGEQKNEYGSLLELCWGGTNTISLGNGQTRKFIQDGDSIIMRGWANPNGVKIGFGECEGTILPAFPQSDYY